MGCEADRGRYVERETGAVRTEEILQRPLFAWLYGTPAGRRVRPLLLESRLLHEVIGWYADSSWSRRHIAGFARAARVDLAEAAGPIASCATFNEFFTRRLDPRCRPIDPDPAVLIAPGDGKLLVQPAIGPETALYVKGVRVRVAELVGDAALAARFAGGSALVLRLYLGDYHRLHFPAPGVAGAPRALPGGFYSVSPFAGNDVNFYCRNRRTVTWFESVGFGRLCFVDVGGFLIAGIRPLCAPGERVRKGQERSAFAFGGSTLVQLAEAGRVRFDADLVAHSAGGLETYVKLGTRIGVAAPI